ncbi:hypothetical protein A3850_005040 [Lewinella sp. 4G2]|nr:hypothetical protein A3850_005040 [Lewinella sp. 4G2]
MPIAQKQGVNLYVKRDDLYSLKPGTALQGNKVRKLLPVLEAALEEVEPPVLLSFGGAYSNHLAALATAGAAFKLPVHLIIRGEEVDNPLLQFCAAAGARLEKVTRFEYRRRNDPLWVDGLQKRLAAEHKVGVDRIWLIPEGGTTEKGVANVGKLVEEMTKQLGTIPDYCCVSAGTGGTAAGIIRAADPTTRIEVYPALRGNWMRQEIEQWLNPTHTNNWTCVEGYEFGGYGKFPTAWKRATTGLATRAELDVPGLPPLEPIYTAKLFSGVLDRLKRGVYASGSNVVIVHTGGIY